MTRAGEQILPSTVNLHSRIEARHCNEGGIASSNGLELVSGIVSKGEHGSRIGTGDSVTRARGRSFGWGFQWNWDDGRQGRRLVVSKEVFTIGLSSAEMGGDSSRS